MDAVFATGDLDVKEWQRRLVKGLPGVIPPPLGSTHHLTPVGTLWPLYFLEQSQPLPGWFTWPLTESSHEYLHYRRVFSPKGTRKSQWELLVAALVIPEPDGLIFIIMSDLGQG